MKNYPLLYSLSIIREMLVENFDERLTLKKIKDINLIIEGKYENRILPYNKSKLQRKVFEQFNVFQFNDTYEVCDLELNYNKSTKTKLKTLNVTYCVKNRVIKKMENNRKIRIKSHVKLNNTTKNKLKTVVPKNIDIDGDIKKPIRFKSSYNSRKNEYILDLPNFVEKTLFIKTFKNQRLNKIVKLFMGNKIGVKQLNSNISLEQSIYLVLIFLAYKKEKNYSLNDSDRKNKELRKRFRMIHIYNCIDEFNCLITSLIRKFNLKKHDTNRTFGKFGDFLLDVKNEITQKNFSTKIYQLMYQSSGKNESEDEISHNLELLYEAILEDTLKVSICPCYLSSRIRELDDFLYKYLKKKFKFPKGKNSINYNDSASIKKQTRYMKQIQIIGELINELTTKEKGIFLKQILKSLFKSNPEITKRIIGFTNYKPLEVEEDELITLAGCERNEGMIHSNSPYFSELDKMKLYHFNELNLESFFIRET